MRHDEKQLRLHEIGFSTHDLWSYRPSLIWLYRKRFAGGLARGRDTTLPFRLWRVIEGEVLLQFKGQTLNGRAGDWLLIPPCSDSQRVATGTELVSVAIESHSDGGRDVLAALAPARLPPHSVSAVERDVANMRRWVRRHGLPMTAAQRLDFSTVAPAAQARLQSVLWRLIATLLDAAAVTVDARSSGDPRVWQVLDVLAAHAASSFPDRAILCRGVGLSWRRIEQLFQQTLHDTPQQMHDRYRARAACRRLLEPDVSIKTISFELGFSSPARFSQWFSRMAGRSPRSFRTDGYEPARQRRGHRLRP